MTNSCKGYIIKPSRKNYPSIVS